MSSSMLQNILIFLSIYCWLVSSYNGSNGDCQIDPKAVIIQANEFHNCHTIVNDVIIPDSVTSIGEQAFSGSHITSLVLGSGLETIEDGSFANIHTLRFVVIKSKHIVYFDPLKAFYGSCSSSVSVIIESSEMFQLYANGFRSIGCVVIDNRH